MSDFNIAEMGARIKEQRHRLGYTQQYVYDKLDISQNHYSRVENGRDGISFENLLKLSEILDVSIDYLITGKVSGTSCPEFVSEYNSLSKAQREFIVEQIQLLKKYDLK